MKKKIIWSFGVFLLLFFIWLALKKEVTSLPLARESISISDEEVMRLSSSDLSQPYFLEVFYPVTDYEVLNQQIQQMITNYVSDFEQSLSPNTVQNDQMYSLMISYETYEHPPFVSYRFTIFMDTGGAHPNHFLWTIVFDQEEKRMISITDLEKKYPTILSIFSRVCREVLMSDQGIVNISMLFEGTNPTSENFSHFVFTSQGILIFFEYYQVAPYSSGEFQVLIPYEQIKTG